MHEIKVCCFIRGVYDVPSMLKYLHIEDLDTAKNIVWDENKPDFVFASEVIYIKSSWLKKFNSFEKYSPICIYFAYEAMYPDMNIFDYAIVTNRQLKVSDRIIRIPPRLHYKTDKNDSENKLTEEQAKLLLKNGKRRFCNFLYSDHNVHHPARDILFEALSEYKHVDSLGYYRNNVGTLIGSVGEGRFDENFPDTSARIKSYYKFSITAENAFFDGYISEKLLASFQAHTVPIYWGDKDVALEFNPEAFINCHDYNDIDDIVKRVKEVDENDDLWVHIVSQPWQTEAQKKITDDEIQKYRDFFTRIFTSPISEIRRRCDHTNWETTYRNWVFKREFMGDTDPYSRIVRVIRNPKRLKNKLQLHTMKSTPFEEFFND